MRKVRAIASVDRLPTEVYGPANMTWWGALGGEVIEGFVVLLAVFAYFYLGEPIRWNYAASFACLFGAIAFAFWGRF